ncbi:hypothetical protein HZC34_06805 [Candidatus Saganbacteria bacterium]|nr:hypothetical protein [Candidatus Saganbacteria bacterium]
MSDLSASPVCAKYSIAPSRLMPASDKEAAARAEDIISILKEIDALSKAKVLVGSISGISSAAVKIFAGTKPDKWLDDVRFENYIQKKLEAVIEKLKSRKFANDKIKFEQMLAILKPVLDALLQIKSSLSPESKKIYDEKTRSLISNITTDDIMNALERIAAGIAGKFSQKERAALGITDNKTPNYSVFEAYIRRQCIPSAAVPKLVLPIDPPKKIESPPSWVFNANGSIGGGYLSGTAAGLSLRADVKIGKLSISLGYLNKERFSNGFLQEAFDKYYAAASYLLGDLAVAGGPQTNYHAIAREFEFGGFASGSFTKKAHSASLLINPSSRGIFAAGRYAYDKYGAVVSFSSVSGAQATVFASFNIWKLRVSPFVSADKNGFGGGLSVGAGSENPANNLYPERFTQWQ